MANRKCPGCGGDDVRELAHGYDRWKDLLMKFECNTCGKVFDVGVKPSRKEQHVQPKG